MSDSLRDALSFRRFAAFTTGLTLVLITLGIYTAATGSGLACSAQWPLCDNGLLPQTIPSFIEWFHRLVAMVTGFFILGTAVWAWRTDEMPRRGRFAATLALLFLPLQISVGAITVTLSGLVPGGYAPPTQAAHLLTALVIFTLLAVTTLFAFEGRYRVGVSARLRRALPASIALLLVSVLFGRLVPAVPYTPGAQAGFYATSLVLFGALLASAFWIRGERTTVERLLRAALVAVFVSMLLGRDLIYYTDRVRLFNLGIVVLTFAFLGVATVLVRRDDRGGSRAGRGVASD